MRKRELNFPSQLGIAPALDQLDRVPQFRPIESPIWGVGRRQYFDVSHPVAAPVVELEAGPVIDYQFSGPISGGGGNCAPLASTNHLRGKTIDGHKIEAPAPLTRQPPNARLTNADKRLAALETAKAAKPAELLERPAHWLSTAQRRCVSAMYKRAINCCCQPLFPADFPPTPKDSKEAQKC